MNGFNRSFVPRPTETEKKGRKLRNHREDACRCFSQFVKLHCHDCPALKPCPIHGNFFHHTGKEQKVDREQNVIISFHPSTKTERLLQPIKSLLAHCNSETKIKFQYYSPENTRSKESLKPQNGQHAYENFKRGFNSNILLEKTKSFVASKNSKVKKLKQCFHSPCNSITQKTRSQTSIKEKLNQILREEAKQTRKVLYNAVPEVPPDDQKHEPTSKWFSSDKGSLKHYDFLSDEKLDSDFITVTQQDNTNAIQHKIFEIKHRKGLNNIPLVGYPKQQTHFVYSTVNVTGGPRTEKREYTYEVYDQKHINYDKSVSEDGNERGKNVESCGSEKTNWSMASSSSGSVYITPFIFVPKGVEDSDTEIQSKVKQVDMVEEGVQVDVPQTPRPMVCQKQTQTSLRSEKSLVPTTSEKAYPKVQYKSVLLQTESLLYEGRICRSSKCMYMHDYEPNSRTKVEEIHVCSNERAVMTRTYDDESSRQSKRSEMSKRTFDSARSTKTKEIQKCSSIACMRTPDSGRRTRTVEMQAGSVTPRTEVLIKARWDSGMRDKTSQTEDLWNVQVSVKTFESGMNKSQGSVYYSNITRLPSSNKGIQTSFYRNSPTTSEFLQLSSPEVTYVIKPFEEQESDQAVDKLAKTWWGKSHSDSDLLDGLKCGCCQLDAEHPYLQSNISKNSEVINITQNSTTSKVYESGTVGSRTGNCTKTGNVTLRTKETVERFSDSKQTSTREEELSAAISDLSELKKIIQQFFEKGSLTSKRTCECGRTLTKEGKADTQTMTDSYILPPKQEPRKNFIDRHVQTVLENFPKEIRSVNLRDNGTQSSERKREKKTAHVQTSVTETEKKEVEIQVAILEVPKKAEKNDIGAQTNVKVLLEEAEQERPDSRKIKLRQTVVIDKENESETFFICSVCGREMKHLVDAATNTSSSPEQQKLTPLSKECTESFEVKMVTKKIQSTDLSKTGKGKSQLTSEKTDDRNDRGARKPIRQQEDSTSPESSQKSRLPVPIPTTLVNAIRFRNETVVQRTAEIHAKDMSQQKYPTCDTSLGAITTSERDCICDTVPFTSRRQKVASTPNEPNTSKAKPPTNSEAPRRENMEVQTSRRNTHTGANKSKRNNQEHYPVWVTQFWPKEIIQATKSIERAMSDIPSSDDSKSQIAKQKRRFNKDLETAAAIKKIKVDAKQEFLSEPSDMLRHGQLKDFKICLSNFTLYPPKTQEDDRYSTATDEQAVKTLLRSLRETSLDVDEDFLLDSEPFSDSSNTENSFFGAEEEDEETTTEELSERHNFNVPSAKAPKLKPQSHSAVTFNKKPLFPDDRTTSKSLNALLFFINPKKPKRLRRKHSK